MTDVKSFTCVDCGASGEQQVRGRKRLRCQPCDKIRRAALSKLRSYADRKARSPLTACEACGVEYRSVSRSQRWCSQSCAAPNKPGSGPRGRSSKSLERQRLYWQAKNRRRRAAKRGGISESYTLAQIAERDQWLCQLCRKPVPEEARVPDVLAPTIDHIVPVSKGGDDTRANVQLAHFGCNSSKGARGSQQLALIG
ncbi:HNH endonuclease signature motif containing protein [Streptomyces sp. NPDC046237]|uniref:HNH endonuclease n=1 Tax=Streptomyces sp. NPDC046237 TaxID=3154914 RepID=UPI0033CB5524